jgi:hypothetical protein
MSSSRKSFRHPGFVLRLLLPEQELALPLPEDEATLRVDLDDDPALELKSGTFQLTLNAICFRPEEQS